MCNASQCANTGPELLYFPLKAQKYHTQELETTIYETVYNLEYTPRQLEIVEQIIRVNNLGW